MRNYDTYTGECQHGLFVTSYVVLRSKSSECDSNAISHSDHLRLSD